MFSGAVKIGDLNDFIAPSQACVVNIGAGKADKQEAGEVGAVQLQRRTAAAAAAAAAAGIPATVAQQQQQQQQPLPSLPPLPAADPVKISLHDCLACSGCVTSAETVLLQQQSVGELEAQLSNAGAAVAITLSPQSITSLAVHYGLSPRDAAARLALALRTLGAAAVFDLSCSRDVALLETAAEFVHRYRLSQRGATELASTSAGAPAMPGTAVDSGGSGVDALMEIDGASGVEHGEAAAAAAAVDEGGGQSGPQAATSTAGPAAAAPGGEDGWAALGPGALPASLAGPPAPSLPMLASACPGWVCYAEKTHGSFVLHHISAAKSPQAVAGTLIKRVWAPMAGLATTAPASQAGDGAVGAAPPHRRLFHCAVMPCYDKKLEASREDFYLPGTQEPEVDCVLATAELLELLQKRGLDLPSLPAPAGPAFDRLPGPAGQALPLGDELRGVPGGSGGYLEFVFRAAARELFGRELPPGPLRMEVGRNADFRECSLEVGGRRVLRFASAYGFRNIQGLMRKIRLGRCEYDYVEIMACPAGCLNGGGQLRPAKGETPQQLIERLEMAYHSAGDAAAGLVLRWPQDSPEARQVYEQVVNGRVGSPAAMQLFHTQYHKREKSVTAALGDW